MPPPPPPPATAVAPAPQSTPCDPVQTLAMTTTFQTRANAEAPRMKPEGAPVCAVLPEGESTTGQPFMLEPGYCYTFLGQSLPPVADIYVEVKAEPPAAGGSLPIPPQLSGAFQSQTVVIDNEFGDKVSLYSKKDCYQWALPLPVTAKLVVKAAKGSGPVAAQVYRRKL
jgi:hypothetical protein